MFQCDTLLLCLLLEKYINWENLTVPKDTKYKAGPYVEMIPNGDNRPRMVCLDCGFIHYDNPKVVAGAVCVWEEKFLLCRRSIEPRKGYWTVPAGFLELGETIADGAAREVWEEAQAEVEVDQLLGIFEIPRINQIYILYKARMLNPKFSAGPESMEVELFSWDEIPWEDIAFPAIKWSLERYACGGPPVGVVYDANKS